MPGRVDSTALCGVCTGTISRIARRLLSCSSTNAIFHQRSIDYPLTELRSGAFHLAGGWEQGGVDTLLGYR
jgi:hypothetical protein